MSYTRNSDLSYYERNRQTTNCGSYALRLNEWYHLNRRFEDLTGELVADWIEDRYKEGYSEYEISCFYGRILAGAMLLDFSKELTVCDGEIPETNDVELIAFNTFCTYDEAWGADCDFHFKVFRNGRWKEKCGKGIVRDCDDYWGGYIGKPIYLYHKIS